MSDDPRKKILRFMEGVDIQYVIPVYQRNYDWRIEQCKQLFSDLVKTIKEDRKSHFFGSIVSKHIEGEFQQYLIIDGQQRLTTITLLLLAMYNLLESGEVHAETPNLARKIKNSYIINEYATEDKFRIRLKPVKNDAKALECLLEGQKEEFIPDSNLTLNYNYFRTQILRNIITIDELFQAINRLDIVGQFSRQKCKDFLVNL